MVKGFAAFDKDTTGEEVVDWIIKTMEADIERKKAEFEKKDWQEEIAERKKAAEYQKDPFAADLKKRD